MTQIILNGGSFSQVKSYVGPARELIVDDSNQELLLQDGVTPGGIRFQSRDGADLRYQAGDDELTALSGLKPTDKGILVRLNPGQYAFRQVTTPNKTLTITYGNGVTNDIQVDLAATIPGAHTFQEDTTFSKRVLATEFDGPLKGDSTGTHTGGLDARGKTVQFDDGAIEPEAVDGLIALKQQVEDALNSLVIPAGMIMMWRGSIETIPSGWVLCDGTKGTPDLRSKFVAGAGTDDQVGQTGGATSHSHVVIAESAGDHAHNIEVGNTALDVTQIPAHTHQAVWGGTSNEGTLIDPNKTFATGKTNAGDSNYDLQGTANAPNLGRTSTTGQSQPHTHGAGSEPAGAHVHVMDVQPQNHTPPYFSLAFVMKVAQ